MKGCIERALFQEDTVLRRRCRECFDERCRIPCGLVAVSKCCPPWGANKRRYPSKEDSTDVSFRKHTYARS